jgi:hypothetical protein
MNEESNNRDAVGSGPEPVVHVLPRGETSSHTGVTASGDAAYNKTRTADAGRLPPAGVPVPASDKPTPRRLRRLHRVWPDRDGNISYFLTMCVDGRARVLNNDATIERLLAFLLDSPTCYHWFGRRFVVMPDHIHLIAYMGHDAIRLGQWIKALKAVVGGLERREERPVRAPGLQGAGPDAESGDAAYNAARPADVGRLPSQGVSTPPTGVVGQLPATGATPHEFTRIKRAWRWQDGYHDHKFRTPESESRKWEYVCLNPVRYGLVKRPEEWPYGGEIFYDEPCGPRLVRGTPPLLETGMLIEEDGGTPREGTRPTT